MDVSFYCHGSQPGMRFRLYRAGVALRHMESASSTAEFRITNARLEDGGNYTCLYESLTEPPSVSPHSDPIELVVAGFASDIRTHQQVKFYPKPTISLSPSGELAPGSDVSFYCHGSRSGVRFRLYRAGVALRHMEPAGSTAEFRITNARLEDRGSYTCLYESLTEPPSVSPHSDPIELVVAGFASDIRTHQQVSNSSVGVDLVSLSLCPTPEFYPKPTISLSPSGELAPGSDVSFYCHGSRSRVRFRLYRAGVALRHTEPASSTAEFRIANIRREDGGSYTCLYESLTEPPSVSHPSDPIELVVAGADSGGPWRPYPTRPRTQPAPTRPGSAGTEFYPKPTISLSPSGELAPGSDVSFYCHGSLSRVRFRLYRAGVALRHTEPTGSTAEFRIANIRREDGGSYTCLYESLTEPPSVSHPSDPIELVVAGADSGGPWRPYPTRPRTQPAPTRPGSTGTGSPPKQNYSQANVVRLGLAAGVLLALVAILAEAGYSRR
ncbi:leukocyte immunoglobulin-like receptor subfamily A member 6 [Pelodiscus sinensis]|uniref:leukocyte immunoglobulin-like receptor subfamily A member 6 n=1 Tax=Pelodiscus sinensis TaxID=13735 RepID=UPI003F6B1A81